MIFRRLQLLGILAVSVIYAGVAAAVMWGGDWSKACEIRDVLEFLQDGAPIAEASRDMLIGALHDDDSILVAFAAYTLGESRGDPIALAALRETDVAIREANKDSRFLDQYVELGFIRVAITKLEHADGGDAALREALWPLLENVNVYTRVEAAKELVRLRAAGVEDVLTRWIESKESQLCNWAYDLRRELRNPENHRYVFECSAYGSLSDMIHQPDRVFGTTRWCEALRRSEMESEVEEPTLDLRTSAPTSAPGVDGSIVDKGDAR